MKKLFILFIISSSLFTSCNNFENGPLFSFISIKDRIDGKWKLVDLLVDDQTDYIMLELEQNIILEFDKEGYYEIKDITTNENIFEGNWSINNDKNAILIDNKTKNTHQNQPISYDILRLTNNELWIRSQDPINDKIIERHYNKIK